MTKTARKLLGDAVDGLYELLPSLSTPIEDGLVSSAIALLERVLLARPRPRKRLKYANVEVQSGKPKQA